LVEVQTPAGRGHARSVAHRGLVAGETPNLMA
jgi:hypothetical protein